VFVKIHVVHLKRHVMTDPVLHLECVVLISANARIVSNVLPRILAVPMKKNVVMVLV
jgi:hypothetical protein